MKIQILGSGCAKCKALHKVVQETAQKLGIPDSVEYSTDIAEMATLGAMRSPVFAIDGKILSAGKIPTSEEIETALKKECCGDDSECCSSEKSEETSSCCDDTDSCCSSEKQESHQTLTIIWQRLLLDSGDTCERCGSTEGAVEQAKEILENKGISVILEKKELTKELFEQDPLASNAILLNGKPLEFWINGKVGESECCGACGDNDCRTIEKDGNVYEAIPAEMIVEAGFVALGQNPNSCCITEERSSCCDEKISTKKEAGSCTGGSCGTEKKSKCCLVNAVKKFFSRFFQK